MSVHVRLQNESTERESASAALDSFIDLAKGSMPYADIDWEANLWGIGSANVKARAHMPAEKRLLFTPHYGARIKFSERVPFEPPFADLVKACLVKRRLDRGMESGTQMVFLRSTRYLYDALPLPVRRDTTLIARGHFVAAETACMRREKESSAYRACVFLEEFARMLDRYGLCRANIEFRTSMKRPLLNFDRTSANFEERTAELPTAAALVALASIANDERLRHSPRDLLRMRIAELLFVCGFRVGEVLTLPADPLVRESVLDNGLLRIDARTGEPIERIGLRYWPEKGGEPIVKWVPTIANEMILRAINDIETLCAPARKNAQWLEAHPGDVNLDVMDHEWFSMQEASKILGIKGALFTTWLGQRGRGGKAMLDSNTQRNVISGLNLRRAIASDRRDKPVLRRQNGTVQSLGQTLLVMYMYDWSENRATNYFISMPIRLQFVSDFLSGKAGMPSVFERFESVDVQGRPFRFRTHDFRRLVNIVAQRGGLSQVEIAQWMGRKRIEDNSAYDLRSAAEMAEEMRALIEKNEVFGGIADQVRALPITERADFLSQRLTMLHTTPHGQCGSNIAENPCETAVSCLGGCRHYLRRKNDQKSRKSLLRIERDTLIGLDRAHEAGYIGQAKNWIDSQERTLRTVRAALAIDDDLALVNDELYAVTPDGPDLGIPL